VGDFREHGIHHQPLPDGDHRARLLWRLDPQFGVRRHRDDLGFVLASRLPVAATIAIAVGFELFTGWAIRDNLTLNVIMLVHPIDAIKAWQGGG
jgi:hypothetical protein